MSLTGTPSDNSQVVGHCRKKLADQLVPAQGQLVGVTHRQAVDAA
jgi:hypothetical protein